MALIGSAAEGTGAHQGYDGALDDAADVDVDLAPVTEGPVDRDSAD